MMHREAGDISRITRAIAERAPRFDETGARIALSAVRLLLRGRPVEVVDVAAGAGVPADEAEELLSSWPGCVVRDASGRIAGFSGLSLSDARTRHRFRVDGVELAAWCAWDMLLLPDLIGRSADAESVCPVTAERISVRVSPDGVEEASRPEAVVSFLIPEEGFGPNVFQSFCRFVHFLASPEAGGSWVEAHPGTFLLGLDEAFELGRRINSLTIPSTVRNEDR